MQDGCDVSSFARRAEILRAFDWPNEYRQLEKCQHGCSTGNMTLVNGWIGPGRMLRRESGRPYGFACDVEIGSVHLTVVNLHLAPLGRRNPLAFAVAERQHLGEMSDRTCRFRGHDGPVVAAGDFNSFWPAPGCWFMRRHWNDCRASGRGRQRSTRPTFGLPFVIDHVFVRGNVRPVEYRVIEGGGLDHRPVIVGLDFDS